jgi:hypothetical protein
MNEGVMIMLNRKTPVLLALLLALAAWAGCSGDQAVAPTARTAPITSLKYVGPGDIVLALDVSDAVTDETLSAMVAGLASALGDGALVPTDGSITMAAVVYGDTIAAPYAGFVAVTAENLETTIVPALEGLLDDRLVTGGEAALDRALVEAAALLGSALADDQHVLVAGSGAASDSTAAQAACTALTEVGIMTSAAFATGGTFLAECVATSGGWIAGDVDDWSVALAGALAYMLHVDLELTGSAEALDRGAEFIASAAFFRGMDPAAYPLRDAEIGFTVIEGPQSGATATATTDTLGVATFAYLGEGGPGTDVIVASALHPGSGLALTDTVAVTWRNLAPDCDPGGPYAATVDGDTVRIMLDASASADADGDTLTFAWSLDCDGASFDDPASATPVLTMTGACLCSDTLLVDLVVDDGFATSSCEAIVTLDDRRPPEIVVRDEPLELWPPNHKHSAFTPAMFVESAEDACGNPIDLDGVVVLEVRSDEPDDDRGDGKTVGDMRLDCPNTVHLRAERMGGGDGRVYTIAYRLTGENGESVDFEGVVVVPHDQGGKPVGEDPAGGWTLAGDCAD